MGTLFIVATPIGNLGDITLRAIKTLFAVDVIICEDTRHTGLLLSELAQRYAGLLANNIANRPQMVRFDEHTEAQKTPEIIDWLESGKNVALVSDAGTPLLSDPGYKLVALLRDKGLTVTSLPGASAVLTALTTSGLGLDHFFFLGYPPEKKSHRLKLFQHLLQINRLIDSTYVFYCAPHKLLGTIEDLQSVLGDVQIVIAKELTKIYESVWRGKISAALTEAPSAKGELVILFRLKT